MGNGFRLLGGIGLAIFGGAGMVTAHRDLTPLDMRFSHSVKGSDIYYKADTSLRPDNEKEQWTHWRVASPTHVVRCEPVNANYEFCETEQNGDVLETIIHALLQAGRIIPEY
jgi:hypothetical protein